MKQQVTLSFRPVTASYVRKGFGWQFFFTEALNSHPYVTLPGLDPRSTYEVRLLLGNGVVVTPYSASLYVRTFDEGQLWAEEHITNHACPSSLCSSTEYIDFYPPNESNSYHLPLGKCVPFVRDHKNNKNTIVWLACFYP